MGVFVWGGAPAMRGQRTPLRQSVKRVAIVIVMIEPALVIVMIEKVAIVMVTVNVGGELGQQVIVATVAAGAEVNMRIRFVRHVARVIVTR
jgi:hypothetical protein